MATAYFDSIILELYRCDGNAAASENRAAGWAIMLMFLNGLWSNDQGQDLIEYTLLMAFVTLASAGLFINSGASVSKVWSTSNTQLSKAASIAAS